MIIENVRVKYCKIDEPDENGKFKIIFAIDNKKERQNLIDIIDADWKDKKSDLKGKFKKPANMAYFEAEHDETGEYADDEDTGTIIFTANRPAVTLKGKEVSIAVYNQKGAKFEDDNLPNIGKGSIINLSTSPYTWKYKKLAGTKLNLDGIQLVKLVEFSGGDTFGAIDGFEKEDKKKSKKKKKKSKSN